MSQKLILPLRNCNVNAGYKTAAYQKNWGYPHYGIDLGEPDKNRTVYSPGNGTVIAAGMDGNSAKERMGNALVLLFPDVCLPDGRVLSLACRMFHLDKISVRAGQTVLRGEKLGIYGNTGANTSGPHLHLEFDSDTAYPQHAVGIRSSGKIIKKGSVDSTLDPAKVWFLGEGQQLLDGWGGSGVSSGWLNPHDLTAPKLTVSPPETDWEQLYRQEKEKLAFLKASAENLIGQLQALFR